MKIRCGGGTYARRHRPASLPRFRASAPRGKRCLTAEYPANGSFSFTTIARVCSSCGHPSRLTDLKKESMVKPHGSLVTVSFMPHGTSTPVLSTWSSSRSLQGSCDPGRSHLVEGFTLRCFQRFSRPHIATERCRWHDNSYTRGAFNPVLSY